MPKASSSAEEPERGEQRRVAPVGEPHVIERFERGQRQQQAAEEHADRELVELERVAQRIAHAQPSESNGGGRVPRLRRLAQDAKEIAGVVADAIGYLLQRKPMPCWGWPPAPPRWPIYDELAARCDARHRLVRRARPASPSTNTSGSPPTTRSRTATSSTRTSPSRVDFAPGAVQGPDGLADDIPRRCAAYEAAIAAAGGVDLQILGIGTDGHIGFNEPGSSLASRTRIKTLTRQTRIDNARFFGGNLDAVPTHCLTQGLATIMAARHVVLVATGPGRRRPCTTWSRAGQRPVAGDILQHHPHVDGAAGRRGREPAAARRLLPGDLPGQAGLAGHLTSPRHRPPDRVDHEPQARTPPC